MLRILFLVLVVMASMAFAQKEEKPVSGEIRNALSVDSLFEEFGVVPNGQIRSYLDNFFNNLHNNPTAKGYILNYGNKRDVSRRERLFRDHITFRGMNASQITFMRGKKGVDLKTQLWIVPEGAKPPTP